MGVCPMSRSALSVVHPKRGLAISRVGASQAVLLSVPWLAGTPVEMLL